MKESDDGADAFAFYVVSLLGMLTFVTASNVGLWETGGFIIDRAEFIALGYFLYHVTKSLKVVEKKVGEDSK